MQSAIKGTIADVNGLENSTVSQTISGQKGQSGRIFLTTPEAAAYLRRSVSWLLRQPDIAYIPGKPNLYAQEDLDVWVDRHTVRPKVRV